jgi:hypothetical protein
VDTHSREDRDKCENEKNESKKKKKKTTPVTLTTTPFFGKLSVWIRIFSSFH